MSGAHLSQETCRQAVLPGGWSPPGEGVLHGCRPISFRDFPFSLNSLSQSLHRPLPNQHPHCYQYVSPSLSLSHPSLFLPPLLSRFLPLSFSLSPPFSLPPSPFLSPSLLPLFREGALVITAPFFHRRENPCHFSSVPDAIIHSSLDGHCSFPLRNQGC